MKGLIIKPYWANLILNGEKTWEIRGSNTNIRGTVAIIKSGTGMIYGTVVLTNSFPVTQEAFDQGVRNHRIPETFENPYKQRYVWEMSAPKLFQHPIPYTHPQGAVIWVNLDKEIAS
jgi:hypothetical protein